MTKSNATAANGKAAKNGRPKKPRKDFPLYAHASGKWAKTVRGKTHYFGSWENPTEAESEYLDFIDAGRKPKAKTNDGPTVADAVNAFLTSKKMKLNAGTLSPRTWTDYDRTCSLIIETFGRNRSISDLGPKDFAKLYAKASGGSLSTLGSHITHTRMVFKFAYESDVIDRPVKFGPEFKAPSAAAKRKAKAKKKNNSQGRCFTQEQIMAALAEASTPLRAMIWLGLNCGFGNTDCSELNQSSIEFGDGWTWIDYPRQKTGVERRIPLWPETRQALEAAIAARPEPNDEEDDGAVFLTKYGQRWVRYSLVEETHFGKTKVKPKQDDAIAKGFSKLLKKLKLKRPGLSFYSLRHTFETVAGGSKDQVAVDAVMGHVDPSMGANYRESIEDQRMIDVVLHVREWLLKDVEKKNQLSLPK